MYKVQNSVPTLDPEALVTVELHVPAGKSRLLGDTGLSLPPSARSQTLERWMMASSLPKEVQRLTRAHPNLSGLQGLLRMRLSRDTPDDSVWILARTTEALVCILVREAGADSAAQLDMHTSFLVAQAHKYCCAAALLLLEGRDCVEELDAFRTFALSHGGAGPVANSLYGIADTRPQLFCAYLV